MNHRSYFSFIKKKSWIKTCWCCSVYADIYFRERWRLVRVRRPAIPSPRPQIDSATQRAMYHKTQCVSERTGKSCRQLAVQRNADLFIYKQNPALCSNKLCAEMGCAGDLRSTSTSLLIPPVYDIEVGIACSSLASLP